MNIAEKKGGNPIDKIFQSAKAEKNLACFFSLPIMSVGYKNMSTYPMYLARGFMTAKTMLLLFKWRQCFQLLRTKSIHHPTNIDIHRRGHCFANLLLTLQACLKTAQASTTVHFLI